MDIKYRTLTDDEFYAIERRAHALRAEASRQLAAAIARRIKAGFEAVTRLFGKTAHKAA